MSIKDVIGLHKDNPLWDEVQKNMEQERLKEILDEIAKPFRSGKYSYDDPAIVAEVKLRYIGLCSHIGGGKDHVANYLSKTLERKCEVVKFATKLTQITGAILGVDDLSLFQDREWKEQANFIWQSNITSNNGKLISPREAQKIIGTDICRSILGDNIWVDAFANQYNDPDTLYIISDLRFQNEKKFVQDNGGVVVFINNRTAAQKQHQKENGIVHDSEQLTWQMYYGDVKADYYLDNNDYQNPQPLQDLVTFIKNY